MLVLKQKNCCSSSDEDEEYHQDWIHHRRRLAIIMWEMLAEKLFRPRELTAEGRQRRQRGLPREALLDPEDSPWNKLYFSGNDQALITVTGFDHNAFETLMVMFRPYYCSYTPWTGQNDGRTFKRLRKPVALGTGRKRMISDHACLGLTLCWYRFRGPEFILQGWFGFTSTHCNVWLRFGRRMLFKTLYKNDLAKVHYPSDEKIKQLQQLINARHPALKNVYATADGLKLYFQATTDVEEQNKFYNGWQHKHYITNLFVFSADGRIIKCVLNAPGSLHDSTLAEWGNVYNTMEEVYTRTGGKVCVDSAFQAQDADYLILSAEDLTKCKSAQEITEKVQATSLRQAAEWGMRAIQGSFPRLKDQIRYEEYGERRLTLKLLVLLYNFRLEMVGLNQLRTVYAPSWSKDSLYMMNQLNQN